jgi:type VI secretion system secreted protein VgrG
MKRCSIWLVVLPFWALSAYAGMITLGTAGSFAVLAGSTVTNTGNTVLTGGLGVYPGTAITGFPPGSVNGTISDGDAVAMAAQSDVTTAYGVLAGLSADQTLTGENLGGLTLLPDVYFFSSSAQLTGTLTLNAEGLSDQVFVFQIGSTLTTASASSVVLINPGADDSVYWQVGSSATLGTTTAFYGNILADQSITLTTGATITCGSALAENGAVTMDTNTVSTGGCESAAGSGGGGGSGVPEPGTVPLLSTGLLALICYGWQSRKRGPGNRENRENQENQEKENQGHP